MANYVPDRPARPDLPPDGGARRAGPAAVARTRAGLSVSEPPAGAGLVETYRGSNRARPRLLHPRSAEAAAPWPGCGAVSEPKYTSKDFTDLLAEHEMVQSLSRPGQCWDKRRGRDFLLLAEGGADPPPVVGTRAQARRPIVDHIDVFFNGRRLHSSLGHSARLSTSRKDPPPQGRSGGIVRLSVEPGPNLSWSRASVQLGIPLAPRSLLRAPAVPAGTMRLLGHPGHGPAGHEEVGNEKYRTSPSDAAAVSRLTEPLQR